MDTEPDPPRAQGRFKVRRVYAYRDFHFALAPLLHPHTPGPLTPPPSR